MHQFNKRVWNYTVLRVWIDSRRHWQSTLLYVNIHINMKPKIISSDLKSNSIFHFISTLWAAVIRFGHVSKAFCSFYTHEDQVRKGERLPFATYRAFFAKCNFLFDEERSLETESRRRFAFLSSFSFFAMPIWFCLY